MQPILQFILGTPSEFFWTWVLFWAVNLVVIHMYPQLGPAMYPQLPATTEPKAFWRRRSQEAFAYLGFVIIAHRFDALAIDRLFDWRGSTTMLVNLYLVYREVTMILRFINRSGVETPTVLTERLRQLASGHITSPTYVDDRVLQQKIDDLQRLMDKMQQYEQLRRQAGGDALSSAPDYSMPAAQPFDFSSDPMGGQSGSGTSGGGPGGAPTI